MAFRQLLNLSNAHYGIGKVISISGKEGTYSRLGIAGIAVGLCRYFILTITSFLKHLVFAAVPIRTSAHMPAVKISFL